MFARGILKKVEGHFNANSFDLFLIPEEPPYLIPE